MSILFQSLSGLSLGSLQEAYATIASSNSEFQSLSGLSLGSLTHSSVCEVT